MTPLFNPATANGSSAAFVSTGRFMTLVASGSFGGGTLTVQASLDGIAWLDTDVSATGPAALNFLSGLGVYHRLNLTGATGPNLFASVAYEQ